MLFTVSAEWRTSPPKILTCGSRCKPFPIHQPGSFSKKALSPSFKSEGDEGRGSTNEWEEDRLEECISPCIPALTFIVVRRCSYHRPTMLYTRLLLRGWDYGLHRPACPTPISTAKHEWSVSCFARGLTDRPSQTFTVGTVRGVCL